MEKGNEEAARAAGEAQLVRHASKKMMETGGYQDSTVEGSVTSKNKPIKTKLAGWKHFVAGGVAGACEVIATMPLDVAKTQMQINPGKYTGPTNALVTIARTSGPSALYFGMPAFLTQTSAKAAIRFFGFAQCKELTTLAIGNRAAEANPSAVNFVSGLGAGAIEASIWTTPTERLKVLRQSEASSSGAKRYGSMLQTARIVMQEQGLRGLFVGLPACVLRQASSVAFRFVFYEPVKSAISSLSGREENVATFMLAGGTVGALSVVINNPMDVVKSRQQSGHKGGMLEIMGDVVRKEGLLGFSRGLSARVPRVFAGQAITFAVYENVAQMLLHV